MRFAIALLRRLPPCKDETCLQRRMQYSSRSTTTTTTTRYQNHSRGIPNGRQEEFRHTNLVASETILQEQRQGLLMGRETLPTMNEHLITSLPYLNSQDFTTKNYAGHIPASPDAMDKKFFYWLFEPDVTDTGIDSKSDDIPLVIWLNGGPACSSMDGLFLEHGPFRLQQNSGQWNIDIHPYSWHKSPAYMLYIDQPVGTGLSFTRKKNYCRNDLEINYDFHYFLQNFLFTYSDLFLKEIDNNKKENIFYSYNLKRPLYFSGESYAGHFIASMIDYILQRNIDNIESTAPLIYIPVAGAAIGNGYVNPYFQYNGADVAYGAGLIDASQRAKFNMEEDTCHDEMSKGNLVAAVCYSLMDSIVQQSFGTNSKYIVSIYDTRRTELRNVDRRYPEGHKDVEMYLGGHPGTDGVLSMMDYKEVLKAIHAEESINAGLRYQECTDPPYYALQSTEGTSVVDQLVRILEHESTPRILFFNGMNDIICNHVGNERLLEALPWKHRDNWIMASRFAWGDGINGSSKPVGYVKEYENLSFLKILDSSHMVPMDSPSVAIEMMRTFLMKTSFQISEQTLPRSLPPSNKACEICEDCVKFIESPSQPYFASIKTGSIGFFLALILALLFYMLQRRMNRQRQGFIPFQRTQDHEVS